MLLFVTMALEVYIYGEMYTWVVLFVTMTGEVYTGVVLFVTVTGEVYTWGDNDEGQLGDGSTSAIQKPRLVAALQGFYSFCLVG